MTRYAKFTWGVLAFNLFVVQWGAVVRATGSGAGCGSHWPLCNGQVVPRSPAVETLIELGHRATSGVALILVAVLVFGAWRSFPPRHPVRFAAAFSGFFILTEALIGAGLVLLELVAQNSSASRGYWVAGHLVNTFLLLGTLALTAWWASTPIGSQFRVPASIAVWLGLSVAGVLVLGMSGAITALGDTLFPASTLTEAKAQTFSSTAHAFIRLRIWHPLLAIAVGVCVFAMSLLVSAERQDEGTRRLAAALVGLYLAQLIVGAMNVGFLAPIALQLTHLLLADLVWILLVLLAARTMAAR
jgi:heme A synthase